MPSIYALLIATRSLNSQIRDEDNIPWLRLEARLPKGLSCRDCGDLMQLTEAAELQFALSLRDYASNVYYHQSKKEFRVTSVEDVNDRALAIIPISNSELREVMSIFLSTKKLFLECVVYNYERELLFVIHAFWQNSVWTSWDVDTNIYLHVPNESFNV